MNSGSADVLIIGGGMVGLAIAHRLLERSPGRSIIILDKEPTLGRHSSGRNSGVLHAGLYYKPGTLKAQVCVSGSRRLRAWCEARGLPINPCGKVIVPQRASLDHQLDVLAERGRANGAIVEFWDEAQLKRKLPMARTSTGRALWSPATAVVKPGLILQRLQQELEEREVRIITGCRDWEVDFLKRNLRLLGDASINYGHLINCSGLQADRVAHKFGVGLNFSLLPFKGLYWQLRKSCDLDIPTNLYPVPDLDIPFLGVHFTPSADTVPVVSIGPTATLAMGRENYKGMEGIEPAMTATNVLTLANQYLRNKGGFRRYVHEQAFLAFPPLLLKAAQELIPSIRSEDIEPSQKVGIRSQLFDVETGTLRDDFLCLSGPDSTHVLNAISPAFTASFALADVILDHTSLMDKCGATA
jgi:L-2-hydroxyglutarate oxidase LhgO